MVAFDIETTYRLIPQWENNQLQFARLLCELEANVKDLCTVDVMASMDVTAAELLSIFDRARIVWESHLELRRLMDEPNGP